MAGKNTAVFGIYQTQNDVEYAVDALRAEGYRNTDVSVLFPETKVPRTLRSARRFFFRVPIELSSD
jgi:hypothetical protein